MARKRSYLERPHTHLQAAAEAHARLTAGEPHPSESGLVEQPPTEPSKQSQAARRQRRQQGGKFA